MTELRERLERWFHTEGGAHDVDICRIVFYLVLLGWFFATPFERYVEVPASMYSPPLMLGWLPPPASAWILAVRWVWLGSLVFSMLGFMTWISTRLAFLFGFYLLSLDWSFGNTHHSHHLIVMCLFTLACSRPAQYISLDRVLARCKGWGWLGSQTVSDETWCPRVCQMCWCLLFFNAGLAKLRHSGVEFLSGQNFQNILLVTHDWYAHGEHPIHDVVRATVFSSTSLAAVLGASGLILEILAPLAFFVGGRCRWILVIGLGLLQVGAYFLFYISEFKKTTAAYIFWIPWSAIGWWLRSKTTRPAQEALPVPANPS